MVADPPTLEVGDSAQDAGQALARPEVRAVFVCDGDRFVGVVTRRDARPRGGRYRPGPGQTPVGEIAEEPHWTVDAGAP